MNNRNINNRTALVLLFSLLYLLTIGRFVYFPSKPAEDPNKPWWEPYDAQSAELIEKYGIVPLSKSNRPSFKSVSDPMLLEVLIKDGTSGMFRLKVIDNRHYIKLTEAELYECLDAINETYLQKHQVSIPQRDSQLKYLSEIYRLYIYGKTYYLDPSIWDIYAETP